MSVCSRHYKKEPKRAVNNIVAHKSYQKSLNNYNQSTERGWPLKEKKGEKQWQVEQTQQLLKQVTV